jgi:(p)ppGpp synthase/HD superfamily hydrolase
MPNTYKNYISNPKKNGYQSIHIAFFGNDKKPVEVQIRTKKMDLIAEKGLAAHFKYKPGFLPTESVMEEDEVEVWLDQIRGIFESMRDQSPDKLIESIRNTLVFDEIYVFTPSNEFRTFPKDSTALDFAFGIHTEIGIHCIGAKIHGKVVPIEYKLQSGDIVEILTSKSQFPDRSWMNCVVTTKARTTIQKYFKEQRKKQIDSGKTIWRDALKNNSIELSLKELRKVVEHFNFTKSDQFYISLADGQIHIDQILIVIKNILDERIKYSAGDQRKVPRKTIELNLPIKLAVCCYPLPDDNLKGEIIPGVEIIAHRDTCKVINEIKKQKRTLIMNLSREKVIADNYLLKLVVRVESLEGINQKIFRLLNKVKGIAIKGIVINSNSEEQSLHMTISISTLEDYKFFVNSLENTEGIISVERFQSS